MTVYIIVKFLQSLYLYTRRWLLFSKVTGLVGFEPTNAAVKVLAVPFPLGDSPIFAVVTSSSVVHI